MADSLHEGFGGMQPPLLAPNACLGPAHAIHCCMPVQVPEGYVFSRTPLRLHGKVITGFQRGSKQMGFPTANLPPEPLTEELEGLPKGVYFG